jgi:hypothetical protein
MSAVVKWTITDGVSTIKLKYNPYTMTSPYAPKNLTVSTPDAQVIMQATPAAEWGFDGYVYTEDEYNKLVFWHSKDIELELTDHLGRTWRVISTQLDITERRDTARNSNRYQYSWKVLNLGEVELRKFLFSEWNVDTL